VYKRQPQPVVGENVTLTYVRVCRSRDSLETFPNHQKGRWGRSEQSGIATSSLLAPIPHHSYSDGPSIHLLDGEFPSELAATEASLLHSV